MPMYQEFVAHDTAEVTCLAFGTKSFQLMATGGEDRKVNIWQIGSTSNLWSLDKNKSAIQSLCFDNDEQCIVSGNRSGSIKIYDLNEGRLARNLSGHQVSVNSLQYHAFGEFIVSGSSDCTMKVWDIRNKTCLQTYSGHDKPLTCVRFSPDGRWVASSSEDGSLRIWDLVAGKLLNSFFVKPGHITSFDFNPHDFMLSAVTSVRSVKVWDLDSMKPSFAVPSDSSPVRAMCHSDYRDGAICTATKDMLKVWSGSDAHASGGTAKLLASRDMGWDGIADMKVTPQHRILAGSFISNFVSVYSIDLDEVFKPSSKPVLHTQATAPRTAMTTATRNTSSPLSAYVAREASGKSIGPRDDRDNKSDHYSKDDKASPVIPTRRQPTDARHHVENSGTAADAKVGSDRAGKLGANISNLAAKNTFENTDNTLPSYHSDFEVDDVFDGNDDDRLSGIDEESDEDVTQKPVSSVPRPPSSGDAPQVHWESDHAAREMATSMGESFWKRFQESQKNRVGREPAANGGVGGRIDQQLEDDSVEDSALIAKFDALGGELASYAERGADFAKLEELLPRSNFVDHPSQELPQQVNQKSSSSEPESPASDRQYRPVELRQLRAQQNQKKVAATASSSRPSSSSSNSVMVGSDANVRNQSPHLEVVGARRASGTKLDNEADLRQCLASADKLISSSANFTTSMLNRFTALKILRRDWERGYVMEALDYLKDIHSGVAHDPTQLLVLTDFLSTANLKGTNKLTLDYAVKLMPILEDMLRSRDGWKNAKVALVVIGTFSLLLDIFGDVIRQARAVVGLPLNAVDISREERIRKCSLCHQVLQRVKALLDAIHTHHHRSPKITDCIRVLRSQID